MTKQILEAAEALGYIIDGLEIQVVYIHGKKTNLIVALSDIHTLLGCSREGRAVKHARKSLTEAGIGT